MIGWSPGCYIPGFVEIGSPVLEKKIFEGFLPYHGRGGHLGHVTKISRTKFQCHYPRLHIKFQLERPSGFREEDL